jgi:AraC-like DNA-binding protein
VSDVVCDACASGRAGEEHAHDDQLVLVRGGVFVKHIGKRQIVAEPTRAVFFNRGVSYRVSHPIDGGDRCTTIHASPDLWRELLAAHDPHGAERTEAFLPTNDRALSAGTILLHQRLRRALAADPGDALRAEEMTLRVIDRVLAEATADAATPRPRRTTTRGAQGELVERTKLALARNPAAAQSLSSIARDVCSSPFHLSRVFRREVGVPIHQYALRLRLSLAAERLLETRDTLSEIAFAHGFSSHSHFTTAFRQTFGVAPSAIRLGWHPS